MIGLAHRDDRYRLGAISHKDNDHDLVAMFPNRLHARRTNGLYRSRSKKLHVEGREVESMFVDVRQPFRFVPEDLYLMYHNK
jgi:hypothetical protein